MAVSIFLIEESGLVIHGYNREGSLSGGLSSQSRFAGLSRIQVDSNVDVVDVLSVVDEDGNSAIGISGNCITAEAGLTF